MKIRGIFLIVIVTLLGFTARAQTNVTVITRYPAVGTNVYTNLLYWEGIAQSQTYAKELITQEGSFSDSYSSAQGEQDYFVVYAAGLPGYGTILTMDPIQTSYDGVESFPLHFHDVLNGGDYNMSRASDMQGTFVIAGETVYVNITYDPELTTRYPRVQLTWGEGASYGDPGSILDDFSQVNIDVVMPPATAVHIEAAQNMPNVPDGIYVGVETARDSYVLQTSTDLQTWSDVTNNVPIGIIGFTYVHEFPPATAGNQFFRVKL